MKSFDNSPIIEDGEIGSQQKTHRSFHSIVLDTLAECQDNMAKEQGLGGTARRIINGEVVEILMPNQLEITVNSIRSLMLLLHSEILDHPKIAKKLNEFEEKLEKTKEVYDSNIAHVNMRYKEPHQSNIYDETKRQQIEEYRVNHRHKINSLMRRKREKVLHLHVEELFPLLMELLKELNYFTEATAVQ